MNLAAVDRDGDEGSSQKIASQIFDNKDFGYYKVNIERPDRRKAQFTADRIEPLRFDKSLREPMEWIYSEWGEQVYEEATLKEHEKAILKWCEDNELNLNAKNCKKLLSMDIWQKGRNLVQVATALMETIGSDMSSDYNQFKALVDKTLKEIKTTLPKKWSASDKNAILNAMSWYDETAEKVVRKTLKLKGDKLDALLHHLSCTEDQLADFGFYATDKAGEFITYEPSSDLRDSETVPLNDEIHGYFLKEVKTHVDEAWINLDSTKIGYEISFNKYFYRHQPLRSMEDVAKDIVALEQQAEGLIAEVLGLEVADVSGVKHD